MPGMAKRVVAGLMSVLMATLALLGLMVVEGDHGLLIYVGLLTTGAFLVGALALRMDMRPRELAATSMWLVPILVITGAALMYVTAHLVSSPSNGPVEGSGITVFATFVLLPAMLVGLFGSLFSLGLSKKKGTRS